MSKTRPNTSTKEARAAKIGLYFTLFVTKLHIFLICLEIVNVVLHLILFQPFEYQGPYSKVSKVGWLLNIFFLSFFNHENYSIKKICVYSKSKIKTKVTSTQNLEHFKMINRRLFIHKFCNNSKKILPSSSRTILIRALVFSFSPRANFSSFGYLRYSLLLIFRFILI